MPFLAPATAATASTLSGVVAGDFDGDGDIDLATTSLLQGEVFWLEDTGTGFLQHLVVGSLVNPRALAVADLDCDGDPDLVINDEGSDSVLVRRNDGGATAWADGGAVVSTLPGVLGIEVGDINGDGAVDVVGGLSSGDVIVWRQSSCGSGTWQSNTIATGLGSANSVAVGDVNLDGRPDIVIADAVDDTIEWRENPGNVGPWASHLVDSAFDGGQSLTLGDVDGDGDLDLAAAANGGSELAWWSNSVGGTIWSKVTISAVPSAYIARLADIDSDGDLDLVSGSSALSEDLAWWDNLAEDGTSWQKHTIDPSPGLPRGLVVVDLGGDGDEDLVFAAYLDGEVKVYENASTARSAYLDVPLFNDSYPFALREIPALDAGDVDGDGDLDVIVVEQDRGVPQALVSWLETTGTDSQGTPILSGPHLIRLETLRAVEAVAAGDVDNDGDLDVMVGNTDTLVDQVVFCRNDGGGSAWACSPVISTSLPEAFAALALADLDGDGDLDLLASPTDISGSGSSSVAWWERDGDPSTPVAWTRHDIESPSSPRRRLVASDLDRDGDLDVIGGGAVWSNEGGSSWTPTILTAELVEDFAVADFDGDGDDEVAAKLATVGGHGLSWFKNDLETSGTWIEYVIRGADIVGTFGTVEAADLDRDGDPDVLVRRFENGVARLLWFQNDSAGAGPWLENEALPTGFDVQELVAVDLDRDSDPDLVATASEQLLGIWTNGGGQFALETVSLAPLNVGEGSEVPAFRLMVHHRGNPGEAQLFLSSLAFLFESAPGSPLTDSELQAVVGALHVFRDDGSGLFEPEVDTELAALPSPALAGGMATIPLPVHALFRLAPEDSPATYFVTVDLAPSATAAGIASLRLTHTAMAGSGADNLDHETPLLLEYVQDVVAAFDIVIADIFADGFESGTTAAWSSSTP